LPGIFLGVLELCPLFNQLKFHISLPVTGELGFAKCSRPQFATSGTWAHLANVCQVPHSLPFCPFVSILAPGKINSLCGFTTPPSQILTARCVRNSLLVSLPLPTLSQTGAFPGPNRSLCEKLSPRVSPPHSLPVSLPHTLSDWAIPDPNHSLCEKLSPRVSPPHSLRLSNPRS